MALKKNRVCIILIGTISLVLSLSFCTKTTKKNSDENYVGKVYLEKIDNGICLQHPSELMWQARKSQKFSNWEDAKQYVKSLSLGGFEDWRLPTQEECLSLSQLIQMKKSNCPMETGGNHWVSNTNNIEAGQWESNVLCDGPIYRWTKDKKGRVNAVRP